ncbi:MAG: FlgD immunoglobulin-like domain containing protein, partial [Candidatus Krumholzibacteria bacterium]|nr:FlgD immunoglobulin-like domain containing protein [Candidatus Krumholzibacteria bacterium]
LNIRHPEFGFNENKVHLFRLLATMLPKFENSFFTRIESSLQAGALIVAGDVVLLADDDILMANIQCAPVAGVPELPEPQLALGRPWPNPFNPSVELTFRLPQDHAGRLSVYDLRGQKVHTLWAGQGTGLDQTFVWRGQTVQGNKAPSGTYLFVLQDDRDGGRRIQRGSLVK